MNGFTENMIEESIMGAENLPAELLRSTEEAVAAPPAPVTPAAPEVLDSTACDEDAKQGQTEVLLAKPKTDDVEAPGPEDDEKEAPGSGEAALVPMEVNQVEEITAGVNEGTGGVEDNINHGPSKNSLSKEAGTNDDASTGGEIAGENCDQVKSKVDDHTNDETMPMAVEGKPEVNGTGEKAEEKDVSDHVEVAASPPRQMEKIAAEAVEDENEGEKAREEVTEVVQASGIGDEIVVKHVEGQSGDQVKGGDAEEALETHKIEIEVENGDKQPVTEEGKSEDDQGQADQGDDAHDTLPPNPKRHKSGVGSTVASKATNRRIDRRQPPRNPERVEVLSKMGTLEDMKKLVASHGRPEADYKVGDVIEVDDLMQTNYEYKLEAPIGKSFAEGFNPTFSPKEMLAYGIFEGEVVNDCIFEFPKEWYEEAIEKGKLSPEGADDSKNYFKVKSRLPAKEWRKRGWFQKVDPHGWFQWYCRYYLGRRLEPDDTHQMARWRQLRRHAGQIKKNCEPGDLSSRVKQRQTLLNWSHDCFI